MSTPPPRKADGPAARLIDLAIGAAWLVGLAALLELLDHMLGPVTLGTPILGAVAVDLGAGRAGVRWSPPSDALPKGAPWSRHVALGAGIAVAVIAAVLAIAAPLGWFHRDASSPSMALLFGAARAAAIGVRDELLFRGIPFFTAAKARIPAPFAYAFAALSSGAAIAMVPGVTLAAIALAVASGFLFAALWTREGGAWGAIGAHAVWVLGVGSATHGGLVDLDWTAGNLAIGASAAGPPAWLAAILFAVAGVVVLRSKRATA